MNNRLDFIQRLLSQACLLCGAASRHALLCHDCDSELPRLPTMRCATCALPIPDGDICGGCLEHPPRYDRVTAVFAYDFPVDALIQAFKYGGNLAVAAVLGEALGKAVAEHADFIIPMPLSSQRLRERGFNQALEIARRVSGMTGIPVLSDACRKVTETRPQAALPWKEREKNVRGAFVCDADLDGRRIAVIDDVMTTGATLNELAKNLRRAGAAHISGWVVARTLPR
ncbi:MAG: ComF family protein [Burkholderiales bacterium]|nr:ComF family protein [Burkholderiales bacterium]